MVVPPSPEPRYVPAAIALVLLTTGAAAVELNVTTARIEAALAVAATLAIRLAGKDVARGAVDFRVLE